MSSSERLVEVNIIPEYAAVRSLKELTAVFLKKHPEFKLATNSTITGDQPAFILAMLTLYEESGPSVSGNVDMQVLDLPDTEGLRTRARQLLATVKAAQFSTTTEAEYETAIARHTNLEPIAAILRRLVISEEKKPAEVRLNFIADIEAQIGLLEKIMAGDIAVADQLSDIFGLKARVNKILEKSRT